MASDFILALDPRLGALKGGPRFPKNDYFSFHVLKRK